MRLLEIFESVSSVLYHATSFPSAEKMLETDMLKGNEGISFTRSLQGAYHKNNKLIGIIFQFDGNKLNQRYKGRPVGTENFLYDPDDYDPEDKETWSHTGRDNGQLEDRILSDKISPVMPYIVSAIAYLPEEYVTGSSVDEFGDRYDQHIKSVENVLKLLKQNSIQVRYVTSEKALASKKANDPEGFAKLLRHLRGEQDPGAEQEYKVTVSIYRGEGEWGPDFDYEHVDVMATSHEEAIKQTNDKFKQNSEAYGVPPDYIDVMSAEDDDGNVVDV